MHSLPLEKATQVILAPRGGALQAKFREKVAARSGNQNTQGLRDRPF